ncbi:hypothetical protein GDO86_007684 [Hymenochirus boettgeri]|uniref:Ankyrin repeat domain-containing protein 45 n=1 Tax=Hymenochirus boettgeri TaxID=247094 RepID=A0A8T2IUS3_9PIPI|nr:hypothetical protein GDO86_007684 [Hymenochirus boettgeri]
MEILSSRVNAVLDCTLKGDVQALSLLFEDPADPGQEKATSQLLEQDLIGRNALFSACILGRCEIIKELVKYGANVNIQTVRGYSPLHCAAAWGQLEVLKCLVELRADIKACNFCNENASELAARYNQVECADFLAWAEAKHDLKLYIGITQKSITDLEKIPGKLGKEYKNQTMNACKSKNDWLEHTKNPTTQDFVEQRQHLETIMQTILSKINTSRPESEKSHKR